MRGPFERVVILPTKEKPFVRLQLFALDLGGCFVELGHQGDVAESENWLAEHYVDPGGQEQWLYLRGRGLLGRRPPGNPRGKGRPKIEGLSAMGLVENKTNAASDAQRRFQVARQLLLAPATLIRGRPSPASGYAYSGGFGKRMEKIDSNSSSSSGFQLSGRKGAWPWPTDVA